MSAVDDSEYNQVCSVLSHTYKEPSFYWNTLLSLALVFSRSKMTEPSAKVCHRHHTIVNDAVGSYKPRRYLRPVTATFFFSLSLSRQFRSCLETADNRGHKYRPLYAAVSPINTNRSCFLKLFFFFFFTKGSTF